MKKMLKYKKAEGWQLPSIFGIVGLVFFVGGFQGWSFWSGVFGFALILLAIWLWIKK